MKKFILTAAIAALSFNALAVDADAGSEFKLNLNNPLNIELSLKNDGVNTLNIHHNTDGTFYYTTNAQFLVTATNAKTTPVKYSITLADLNLKHETSEAVVSMTAEVLTSTTRDMLSASKLTTESTIYTNKNLGITEFSGKEYIQFKVSRTESAKLPVGEMSGTVPITVAAF